MKQTQIPAREPDISAKTIKGMLETFSKSNYIPPEVKKEMIKAFKIILQYLKSSGKSMTMTPFQINEFLEKKGLRKLFGMVQQ